MSTPAEDRELAATVVEGTGALAATIIGLIPGAGPLAAGLVGGGMGAVARLIRAFGDDSTEIIDRIIAARDKGLITAAELAADDAAVASAIDQMYAGSRETLPPTPLVLEKAQRVMGCVECGKPSALVDDVIPADQLCPWCRAAQSPGVTQLLLEEPPPNPFVAS